NIYHLISFNNSYGKLSGGGTNKFTEYATNSNVPNLRFSSYGKETGGRQESFSKYSDDENAGDQNVLELWEKLSRRVQHLWKQLERGVVYVQ
ncbi:hypothetical protein PIB30_107418, partial [Stylosanthes scabra]|nr:hypothetical protein [Stylosanthes scabra]